MSADENDLPPRGPDGKFLSDPHADVLERFRPDTSGSALHVYGDRSTAQQRAAKMGPGVEVAGRKIDGKQVGEIREVVADRQENGVSVTVTTTKEIEE